jgi:hypothetical protein
MKRAALCFILGVSLLWVGIAAASPPQLKGKYAFTGEGSCLSSKEGFNPNLTAIGGFSSHSFSVQGVRTFKGDGTGTVAGTAVEITPPPFPNPEASSETFFFKFTYTVAKDGTITTDLVPGSYLGTFLTGPRTGQTYQIDKFSLSGMASNDNKVLTLATGTTEVETHTFSNGDVRPEICHRSRVLIWLGE